MAKSSAAEQARRVNGTIQLLRQETSASRVLTQIVSRYQISRRQAYRYLQQAQQANSLLAVPEQKKVFTVKLPQSLIGQVRRQARQQRASISDWVEQALRGGLKQTQSHG